VIDSHRRAGPLVTVLQVLLALGLIVFFLLVARLVYDFSNPASLEVLRGERSYLADMVSRLPRGIHLVALVLGVTLCLEGPGALVLRPLRIAWHDEIERLLFAIGAGMAVATPCLLALGWLELIRPRPLLEAIGVAALLTVVDLSLRAPRWLAGARQAAASVEWRPWRTLGWAVLTLAILGSLYVAMLGALSPEVQFDAVYHHLGDAAHYAEHGGLFPIVRVTRISNSANQLYQDLFYMLLIPLVGLIGAKVLHWVDAVLSVVALVYFCRIWFRSLSVGLLAGLLFIALPVVAWSSSTASNDLPTAFLTLLTVHAFLRWHRNGSRAWLGLAAASAGYGIGFKITNLITPALLVPGVLGASLLPVASWRAAVTRLGTAVSRTAATVGVILVMGVPWYIWAYVQTGDPVFPFLNGLFRSPYWGPFASHYVEDSYSLYGQHHTLLALIRLPWDLAVNSYQYRSVIGPIFLVLLPLMVLSLAVLRGRVRTLYALLAAFAAGSVLLWYASGALEVRYMYGGVAVGCVVLAVALLNVPWPGWSGRFLRATALTLAGVMMVLNCQFLVALQPVSISPSIAGRASVDLAYLYRGAPAPRVGGQMLAYINNHLTRRDKVYVRTPLLYSYLYSKVEFFNGEGADSPVNLHQWSLRDPDALSHLRRNHIDYVVVGSATASFLLERTELGHHLRVVHRDDADQVLLKVTG
jgi:hypothetical protein